MGRSAVRVWGLASLLAACLAMGGGSAFAASMSFRAVEARDPGLCKPECPMLIVAEGQIAESSAQDYLAFLAAQRRDRRSRSVVLLHSPGGNVGASLRLGEAFRKSGAAVIVARARSEGVLPGRCYSACVYAFIGGVSRAAPKGSEIGVHRMFMYERVSEGIDGAEVSRVYAHPQLVEWLAEYARRMGVSQELVHRAEQVSPDRVHVVTQQEMRRWRLARGAL